MTEQKVSLKDIYEAVHELRCEIQKNYVTKAEFMPVKMIAYGIIGMAGTAVLFAVLARVVSAIAP